MRTRQEAKITANIKQFRMAPWVAEGSETIAKVREYVRTGKRAILDELTRSGAVLAFTEGHNIVVTAGRNVLARLISGDTTFSGKINYGALGTGASPAPVNGSTQLQTEAYRKLASSYSASANIAYVDFFYAAGDCNGTYTEFGNFIDGAAGANTGQLFSYIATGGWTKSGAESLFVSCQYTIS